MLQWWDDHWVHDRIASKLGAALPYVGPTADTRTANAAPRQKPGGKPPARKPRKKR